jgi:hypothetical protein
MVAPAVLSLVLSIAVSPAPAPAMAATVSNPPVKVWLSQDGQFAYGQKAKAYVKAAQDGYMVILYADPRGRIRVLYPTDPSGDQAVKGGKKYEVAGRGGREAFVAADSGNGLVMAAFSSSRFNVDQFVENGHWDYRALADTAEISDPETRLMDIAHDMQSAGRYTYDMASYNVEDYRYAEYTGGHHGFNMPHVSLGLAVGVPYGYGYGYGFGYGSPFGYGYSLFPRYGAGINGFGYRMGGIRSFGR